MPITLEMQDRTGVAPRIFQIKKHPSNNITVHLSDSLGKESSMLLSKQMVMLLKMWLGDNT